MGILCLILLIVALLIFAAAAFNFPAAPPRINLVALGLAVYMLMLLLQRTGAC
jgi:hypothetical protein